jgi:hypothetical protein
MINRRPAVTNMRMTADDVWAVILVLPLLSLAFGLVTFGTTLFQSPVHFIKGYVPTFILVTIFHTALVQISYASRRQFPTHEQTAQRLVSALAFYLLTSFIAIHFSLWLYDRIGLLGIQKTPALVRRCMLVAVVGNLVNGVMYDLFYTFAKMKEALVQKEGLQKEQLRQQFDALKTQVNPHFLFNNLNTLSELIEEDVDEADRFLNEMSKVYRYMLRSRSHAWVPLQQELDSFRSYFYLFHIRYGSMMQLENAIDLQWKQWQIPSLGLHLVVEEAVRTSQFAKEAPLVFQLKTQGQAIVLTYRHQPKLRLIETEGLNWNFISDRFAEQGLSGFTRNENNGMITITFPLLQPLETFATA